MEIADELVPTCCDGIFNRRDDDRLFGCIWSGCRGVVRLACKLVLCPNAPYAPYIVYHRSDRGPMLAKHEILTPPWGPSYIVQIRESQTGAFTNDWIHHISHELGYPASEHFTLTWMPCNWAVNNKFRNPADSNYVQSVQLTCWRDSIAFQFIWGWYDIGICIIVHQIK